MPPLGLLVDQTITLLHPPWHRNRGALPPPDVATGQHRPIIQQGLSQVNILICPVAHTASWTKDLG
jgi:hypothetical protein